VRTQRVLERTTEPGRVPDPAVPQAEPQKPW
jgi:hypothetical protein